MHDYACTRAAESRVQSAQLRMLRSHAHVAALLCSSAFRSSFDQLCELARRTHLGTQRTSRLTRSGPRKPAAHIHRTFTTHSPPLAPVPSRHRCVDPTMHVQVAQPLHVAAAASAAPPGSPCGGAAASVCPPDSEPAHRGLVLPHADCGCARRGNPPASARMDCLCRQSRLAAVAAERAVALRGGMPCPSRVWLD